MTPLQARVAIYFDEDGYLEHSERAASKGQHTAGPMGRHVAGKEFLTAYLQLSRHPEYFGLARSMQHGKALVNFCHKARFYLPARDLFVLLEKGFHRVVFDQHPVTTIHYPAPLEPRMAWARQYDGRHAYALSGITHTICTVAAASAMTQFVAAPFESYDRLICISKAAIATVRSVVGSYCDYLADRFGGKPEMRLKLEHIPLGVDTAKFRPPTDDERAAQRRRLGIADDEVVVLYLGRLLHYGKVHPFPMYHSLSRAALAAGKKVRLILAGWSPTEAADKAFREGANVFAPNIQTTFLDGRLEDVRLHAWWCADIFSFPTDNLQETFPQSVIEAMSCGLPVVAANWDGCRDQVVDGETGFLIPTYMLNGATAETTSKLILGEYTYPHFMARCSQATVVDLNAAQAIFERLLTDAPLRREMGAAGRKRALTEYAWPQIIRRHEEMWEDQERERQAHIKQHGTAKSRYATPAMYPGPEFSFSQYPTRLIEADTLVRSAPDALERLDSVRNHALTEYGRQWRCDDPVRLQAVLQTAQKPTSIAALLDQLVKAKTGSIEAQASIMWMLKYGLLELALRT